MGVGVKLNVRPFKGGSGSPVELEKNKPILVFAEHSKIKFTITEQDIENGVHEIVNIFPLISNNDCALIGHEYKNPLVKNTKVADIMYMHFSKISDTAHVYIYDMKRSLGGKEVILHLIYQLQSSLIHAQNILASLIKYTGIYHVGVITEGYNEQQLHEEIVSLKKTLEPISGSLSFMQNKQNAQTIMPKEELEYLQDFYKRKIKINGIYYDIDIKFFKMKDNIAIFDMEFRDGELN